MTGTIVKSFGKFYTVRHSGGILNCVLRGKMRQDKSLERFSDPVAVGDSVDFDFNADDTGVINSIHERKNIFSRKDKRGQKQDIIAANLDRIVVVQSFKKPKLNLRFVDRLMVRGEKENIPVLLCANKSDLAKKSDTDYLRSYYNGSGLQVIHCSAETGKGMDDLKKAISGEQSIFVGSSGVGKSTLLNRLFPGLNLRISEISESTGKGRHTTTNAEMILMKDDTRIIDTPGMREFGLVDIEPQFLGHFFYEFEKYFDKCSFHPCTHDHEPDCEIKKQVGNGTIAEDRYISYLQILYSIKEYYENLY